MKARTRKNERNRRLKPPFGGLSFNTSLFYDGTWSNIIEVITKESLSCGALRLVMCCRSSRASCAFLASEA